VLTDLQLGAEDGANLARALRESDLAPLHIVAVSGRSPDEHGVDAGLFDGAVRKPVDLDALLGLLRRIP
jgi:CheY-like chemotaxis protein